jgi:hypothetical protein
VIARIVGERLSKGWGQQVLIENRPGGGTNIANEMVVRSEPDGHTVLMGGSSQAAARLYRSLSYDPITDFAPVAFICSYSFFHVRAELSAGEVGQRIHRLRQGKQRQAHARFARHRIFATPLWRTVQAHGGSRHGARRGAAPAMNDLIHLRHLPQSSSASRLAGGRGFSLLIHLREPAH